MCRRLGTDSYCHAKLLRIVELTELNEGKSVSGFQNSYQAHDVVELFVFSKEINTKHSHAEAGYLVGFYYAQKNGDIALQFAGVF